MGVDKVGESFYPIAIQFMKIVWVAWAKRRNRYIIKYKWPMAHESLLRMKYKKIIWGRRICYQNTFFPFLKGYPNLNQKDITILSHI